MYLVSNVNLGYFWVNMTHSENLSQIPINIYFCAGDEGGYKRDKVIPIFIGD